MSVKKVLTQEGIDLEVEVLDRDAERPIRGAVVSLHSPEMDKEAKFVSGNAKFENLPQGLYTIKASAEGYREEMLTVGLTKGGKLSMQLTRSQLPF